MKALHALPLLLLLPTLGGCLQLQGQYMASEVTEGLYAIEHYRARTSELGIDRADPLGTVVRELVYERPWKVRAEVLAPEDHRGQLMIFDGSSYVFWWPRFFFGMRIRGVRVPPRGEVREAILASSLWTLRHYELDELEEGVVAGRAVRRWSATPREGAAGAAGDLRPYTAATDAEYHVPLQLSVPGPPALKQDARPWYELRFESIDFAAAPAPDAFRFQFPPGAIVYEWDLTGPDVTLEEAQARVSFPLLYPQRLPRGHQLQRVVMSRHEDSEMVALLFPQRGRWLSLTEVENLGPILVPELGITVQIGPTDGTGGGAREGVMNFAFGFTVLSWAEGNTALTLIGNLPWPELLEVAATIGPLSASGER